MSTELKEETLTALKTGVNFLEKVKINLDSNELKRKLDEVYYIFEELIEKWERNSTKNADTKSDKKKVTKIQLSAPILPPVWKQQEAKISKNRPLKKNDSIGTEDITSQTKKGKKSLFGQLKNRSKSDEKILSAKDIVHIPLTDADLKDDSGYLKIQEVDKNMIMSSNAREFSKVTKIKLKVNNKAIGARYCCLSGINILLGRELNDQTAEHVLDLSAGYRLKNEKNQYFELIKGEATYSFRFENETECVDWYNSIDNIIGSVGMYSYVSVRNGLKATSNEHPMRQDVNKNDMTQITGMVDKPLQPQNSVEYEYPAFVARILRAKTDLTVDQVPDDSVAQNCTYSYVSKDPQIISNLANRGISLPIGIEAKRYLRHSVESGVLFEDSISTVGQFDEHKHRDILGKPKISSKPKAKFSRERSMST
ncbi:hypothetical protein LOD99_4221 [Oopsacas minuta]|uniref:PH domain-containing protein n=1 Tax=Oopsacas minuta TaxID=111878 RepID=A0AAV7JWL8_9METZ|nr:hypothetical protein LOD99_4221 [Oopsacas minuta]